LDQLEIKDDMVTSEELDILETDVDELLRHCLHLQDEVSRLRAREQIWNKERAHILEQHATVRIRLAAVVSRLKFLECL